MQEQRAILHLVDTISAAAILGTLAGVLPPLAALAAIIWYLVQIYESKTAQRMLRKFVPGLAAPAGEVVRLVEHARQDAQHAADDLSRAQREPSTTE